MKSCIFLKKSIRIKGYLFKVIPFKMFGMPDSLQVCVSKLFKFPLSQLLPVSLTPTCTGLYALQRFFNSINIFSTKPTHVAKPENQV